MKHLCTLILFVIANTGICCFAQTSGSASLYGGSSNVKYIAAGTSADVSETMYIGPGTHTINGTWQIYAQNIIISSAAMVSGTGVIEIYNPSAVGGANDATLVDGNYNANALSVNIELNNASGMQLSNMNLPEELTSAGWTEETGTSGLALHKQLNLNTDGADITLGTGTKGDLIFTSNGSISNYGPGRMIITNNSILSHVVKQNYTSAFVFPVGTVDGDYAPARIANDAAIDVNVSVQNYTGSAADESEFSNYGMLRTWNIYGNTAGSGTTMVLQHESSLNETGFNEASHFITRYSDASPNNTGDNASTIKWQENTAAAGSAGTLQQTGSTSSSMISRSYAALATGSSSELAYFSKKSSVATALPIKIISFKANAENCSNAIILTAEPDDDVREIILQRSQNTIDFSNIHQWATAVSCNVCNFIYNDYAVASGVNYYYRIKIGYNTGKYEYSSIAVAKPSCSNNQRIVLFPNPSENFVYVKGLPANSFKTIQVTDMSGKTWIQQATSDPGIQINTQFLPQGIYSIRILNSDDMVYFLGRFVKM